MTTPAENVDTTDDGQGGTGGGDASPATNTDTTRTDGAGSETPSGGGPAVTGTTDTTGGTGTAGTTTSTSVSDTIDTTDAGYDRVSTDDPAYRDPSGPVPVTGTTDTRNPGGSNVTVNPGSPDAATVGGGDVNPNAVTPPLTNEAYNAGPTKDTTGAGTNPNAAPPADLVLPAPTNVTATVVPGRRAVEVHWTPVPDETWVTGYQVEGSTGGTVRVGKQHDEAEIEEGLVGGNTYTFVVFALQQNGTGRRSTASAPVTIPTGDITNDLSGRDEGV